jgi:uncharacterized membrane protein
MLPNPLHPAIVHFPIALVILLPFFALGALWAIRRGSPMRRAWAVPVAVAAALTLSAFVALRTGDKEGERVEKVVPERVIESHEEAAERFLVLSGVLLLIAGAGLAGGTIGKSARLVATVGAVGLTFAGYQVGRAGGELVYQHGAASAYATSSASGQPGTTAPSAAEVGEKD